MRFALPGEGPPQTPFPLSFPGCHTCVPTNSTAHWNLQHISCFFLNIPRLLFFFFTPNTLLSIIYYFFFFLEEEAESQKGCKTSPGLLSL